jgi:hypothetical protein
MNNGGQVSLRESVSHGPWRREVAMSVEQQDELHPVLTGQAA